MPRTARSIFPNYCYHIINRGNQRARVFHEDADYWQFIALLVRAQARLSLPLIAACLMPNHIHLVIRPVAATDASRWMHWVFTTHVRWHHEKYGTNGRIWQDRFKAFASEQDHHLLNVMRYVERNALRSNLVGRAEDWEWSSSAWRHMARPPIELAPSPVPLPSHWREFTNTPQTSAELAAIRTSVNRQRPFGSEAWVKEQADVLGMNSSLAPIGRPRKSRRVPDC